MVMLRSVFLIMLVATVGSVHAEDLDALLSSLAAPKTGVPVAGAREATPVAPAVGPKVAPVAAPGVAPEVEPNVAPVAEPVAEPVAPSPAISAVEPKVAPVEEPKTTPALAPKVAPVVEPIMPKVAVSPVVAKTVPVATPPGVMAAPAAKVVGAPMPVMAKAPVESSDLPKAPHVQMQITDVHEVVADGLDTLHIDTGGNWLEKRVWYKKAEQLFEAIRMTIQRTSDTRMKFVHEVNQVGQQIDDFYENIGFQKGQIDELLQAVAQDLTTEQDIRGGDLASDERSVRLKVKAEQVQFQAISKDFKLIEDLDDQVDKTMMKAFKEIDACRALETKAWNNFKEIGMELDDKKARVLYYEMENFNKNIEQKMHYLQTNLFQYLQSQLVTKVTQTINQIKTTTQTLQTKGLQLQAILQKDQQGDFLIFQQRDDAKAKALAASQSHQDAKDTDDESAPKSSKKKSTCQPTWYQELFCSAIGYLVPLWDKMVDWFCMAVCCVQTILCKLQEMICRLMGY